MEIYLIQHGLAKSAEEDPQRGLTPEGKKETERVAVALEGRVALPLEIWHSGKTRAEETAEIISSRLNMSGIVKPHGNMAPKDNAALLLNDLKTTEENKMIIGHLPHLPKLLSLLLGLPEENCPVVFRNSAVICLSDEIGEWKIKWILHPDIV